MFKALLDLLKLQINPERNKTNKIIYMLIVGVVILLSLGLIYTYPVIGFILFIGIDQICRCYDAYSWKKEANSKKSRDQYTEEDRDNYNSKFKKEVFIMLLCVITVIIFSIY